MPKNRKQKRSAGPAKAVQPAKRLSRKKSPPRLIAVLVVVGIGATAAALLVSRWFNQRSDGTDVASPEVIRTSVQLTIPRLNTKSWQQLDDPSQDGWQTEVFHRKANAVLKKLGKLLVHGGPVDRADVAPIAAETFSSGTLRPELVETVFRDQVLQVQRAKVENASHATGAEDRFRGPAGLAEALTSLAEPYRGAQNVDFKFKIFRVQPSADVITTRQYFSISGVTPEGLIEQHATWVVHWTSDDPPRITSIGVEDYEQVQTLSTRDPLFADCTQSVLSGNACFKTQLMRGWGHWLGRTEDQPYWDVLGNPGITVGDVNGDGLDDLYLCQERGLPNRLFLQNADGSLRDVSESAGVNWLEDSRSALLVDLDNDGNQDLAVAVVGGVVLAQGDGQGRFAVRQVLDVSDDVMSLCAVDYNRDGRLDLYATAYYQDRLNDDSERAAIAASGSSLVFYDADTGGANSLLRNEIGEQSAWKFTDVTGQLGLDVNNSHYSLAAAWEDFDNDGDQDLYVGNDYGQNNLYRNDDGQFTDVAASAGVEDHAFGMSVSWGDFDRDGWMDLYVANMFSAAGNRITYQADFKPDVKPGVKSRFQHLARGNSLFRNRGDGTFGDLSRAAHVTMGRWAWSSNFVDLNNDGWQDLVVANGFITAEDTGDL